MTDPNLPTLRPVARCSACKLPVEALTALHRDRFEGGMGFEALAAHYSLPDRALSESGVRRHFSKHVVEPEYSPISEAEAPDDGLNAVSTPFANTVGDELSGHALLEAGTRTLAEMVQALSQEYRAAVRERPQVAERAFSKFMKAQTALARCVKQLEDGQTLRDELRRTVPQMVDRCISEAVLSLASLMRENTKVLRQDVTDVANERLSFDEFWNRMIQYENEWPMEVGKRVKAAQTAALKAEEAKVRG